MEKCNIKNCLYNHLGECINCDDCHNPDDKDCISFTEND